MAKKNGRQGKNKKNRFDIDYLSDDKVVIDLKRSENHSPSNSTSPATNRKFQAKNISQGQFVSAIKTNILTFGLGPAGTGKTFCTAAMAAEGVDEGRVKQIVFTRPAVETGPSMGFLPGKLEEKFDHYFSAFKQCLVQLLGKGVVDCAIRNRNLVAEPLAYMRGKTFDNAFVVLDEAQNCTEAELKMFMTRIGESSTFVINGDPEQSDIGEDSGLYRTVQRVGHIERVHVHEFDYEDIVRSRIVRDILFSYSTSPQYG
jgi:phosphate starvation-inducible PhoH-like protein